MATSTTNPNPTPKVAKFPQTEIFWSDGTKFNGFCLISLVPPIYNGITYTEADFGLMYPSETLPQFSMIPIQNGRLNSSLGLYFNADISPVGTSYISRWYDTTKRLIAGPSGAFIVAENPMTGLAIPNLPAPSTGGDAPTPN